MEACNEIEFLKQKIKNLENKNDELQKENNGMKDQITKIMNDIQLLKKNNANYYKNLSDQNKYKQIIPFKLNNY